MTPVMVRYLASAFVDAQDLTPNAQTITALLTALSKFHLLPNMISVLTPNGISQRMAFQSSDANKQLVLNFNRFDFTYNAHIPLVSGLGSFDVFCGDAAEALRITLQQVDRTSTRLTSARDGFFVDLSEEQKSRIANSMFKLPSFYEKSQVFEWQWQVVSRIEREFGSRRERVNMRTAVQRGDISISKSSPVPTEHQLGNVVGMTYDINTLAEDTDARFAGDDIRAFFEHSAQWHGELQDDVLRFIGLGEDG